MISPTTIADLFPNGIPTPTLPDYVSDWSAEIVRDASLGNGGGAEVLKTLFKIDGQDIKYAWGYTDLTRGLTVYLPKGGFEAMVQDYFAAIKAKLDKAALSKTMEGRNND